MSILDKFFDIMKLNDNYDDDDDYLDDDYLDDDLDDEYDDYKGRKSAKKTVKAKPFKVTTNSEDFDDDFVEKSTTKFSSNKFTGNNKVTPMKTVSHNKQNGNMGVCVIKPAVFEDGRDISDTLLEGRTVILNLEGLDLDVAQRIIDFTSGAVYIKNGNLQKISNSIFLVTPQNVDITGDLQNILDNSFDMSSLHSRY